MCLKNHSNQKPQTKRKGYAMRNLFVTVVAALLLIVMVLPAQAGQVSDGDVQPIEDHTWGGDPDTTIEGWVSWWWFVMTVLYFYHLDVI